jgi:cation transporter-like permease
MTRPGSSSAMGIVISLVLVTFGAILTWAVDNEGGSVDPQVVGVILIVIGILVFLISLVLWRTWWGAGFWAPAYGADPDAPAVRRRAYRTVRRRTTYVDEESPPPAGPPAP